MNEALHFGASVQALKQDLSEVFAVYLSFATELEDQREQLLKKVEEASFLRGRYGDEVQSKCRSNANRETPRRSGQKAGGTHIHAGWCKVAVTGIPI